jgi:hypothetical protein
LLPVDRRVRCALETATHGTRSRAERVVHDMAASRAMRM